ncbi:MAG TPA: hypothetical protein VG501_08375 [Rhizomicrobium sp.]|nr:hypothetical protein [Rhizomicrobium sp.]
MGILVICSYRPKSEAARRLMDDHVPLLHKHGLVTERTAIRGAGRNGEWVEIFEWVSEEKSRAAPGIPEIGAHWKTMAEVMDFVPLASLPESRKPFARFIALA